MIYVHDFHYCNSLLKEMIEIHYFPILVCDVLVDAIPSSLERDSSKTYLMAGIIW